MAGLTCTVSHVIIQMSFKSRGLTVFIVMVLQNATLPFNSSPFQVIAAAKKGDFWHLNSVIDFTHLQKHQ